MTNSGSPPGVQSYKLDTKKQEMPQNMTLIALALIPVMIVYFWFSWPLEQTDNALFYIYGAHAMDLSDPYFYPPHLMQKMNIFVVMNFINLAVECDAQCSAISHSAAWGVLAVISVFILAATLARSTVCGLVTALFFAICHGFWVYSTQGEVYVPAIGAMVTAMMLLFTNKGPTLETWRIVLICILWPLGVMYHLVNVLFFIPLMIYFIGFQGIRGMYQWAVVSFTSGAITLACFIIAFFWSEDGPYNLEAFKVWLFEIANRPLTNWGTTENWFDFDRILVSIWSQISTFTLLPQSLTLDMPTPLNQLPLAVIGSLTIGAILLWTAIQIFRGGEFRTVRLFFLADFSANFLLYTWWDPGVLKFRMPSMIGLIFLGMLSIVDLRERLNRAGNLMVSGVVAATIAVMFTFNITAPLELRRSYGPYYAEAEVMHRLAPASCTIYGLGTHLNPLQYYFERGDQLFMPIAEREWALAFTGELETDRQFDNDETCAFVPLGFMTEMRFEDRVTGYLPDAKWTDYLGYFFDVQPAADGNGVTFDSFTGHTDDPGLPYLLVDRTQRDWAESVDVIGERIWDLKNTAVANLGPRFAHIDRHDVLLLIPQTDLRLVRPRKLIFGYAMGDQARAPEEY